MNWNKCQSKILTEGKNQYLYYSIDSNFQGVNKLFFLSFQKKVQRTTYKQYYLPTVEINNYIVIIDGKNLFDQQVKQRLMTYGSIGKLQPIKEIIIQL